MNDSAKYPRKLTWQTADPDDCYGVAPAAITDTERLDWLQNHPCAVPYAHDVHAWRLWSYDHHTEFRGRTLREAIDAARRASQDR